MPCRLFVDTEHLSFGFWEALVFMLSKYNTYYKQYRNILKARIVVTKTDVKVN